MFIKPTETTIQDMDAIDYIALQLMVAQLTKESVALKDSIKLISKSYGLAADMIDYSNGMKEVIENV
jgi:hypothetical protein